MECTVDYIISSVFQITGVDKSSLNLLLESHGMLLLWDPFLDLLIDSRIWILGFLPVLLLISLWKPARRNTRIFTPALFMDAVYSITNAVLYFLVITSMVVGIKAFYETYLPVVNTGLLDGKPLWIQVVVAFLITDAVIYVTHRTMHEVRWLWYFHAIHHSQTQLNPLTVHRVHPFENVLSHIIRVAPIGVIGGEPSSWIALTWLTGLWGYFIHTNVKTNLGFLKYIVVTPQSHGIHHSIEVSHVNKNYGDRLIVWDWFLGTQYKKFDEYPETGIRDGEV